jgi:ferritin
MDISTSLFTLFNKQYNTEVSNYSGYQNLANIADALAWDGFAKFFKEYALDEITHAQKIADFIVARNKTPFVDAIPNPGVGNISTPADWIATAYKKAQNYTAIIKSVYEQCIKENDYDGQEFLRWYISEQRRVENILFDIQQQIGRAGSNAALLIIDQSLLNENTKK